MNDQKILVCSIGTAKAYEYMAYRLGSRQHRTRFAPVAVARLLGLRGARALVVVTEEAHAAWYETVAEELTDAGLAPVPVDVSVGRDEREILGVFSTLAERVPPGARVTLDVTFALRHLPFVYLATLAYCVGLRAAVVEGVYYGAYELRAGGVAPIVDVTTLVHLLDWYHGLRSFRETGDMGGVVSRLQSLTAALFGAGKRPVDLGRVRDVTVALREALAAGLPMEAGWSASHLARASAALGDEAVTPAARQAVTALSDEVQDWAVPDAARARERKSHLSMDRGELSRELRIARWFLDHGRVSVALSILREWIVNAMIVANDHGHRWFDYGNCRKPLEDHLNAVVARAKVGVANESERNLASLWSSVTKRRNELMHSGMNDEWLHPHRIKGNVMKLLEFCERDGESIVRAASPSIATLLVTPLGLKPGVLYSAIFHERPDELMIVTSDAARPRIAEALSRSEYTGGVPTIIELREPHTGFREMDEHINEEIRRRLVHAGTVVVNLTGGTTVMQYAVERLAAEAGRLGVPVRRLALVDRRDPDDQDRTPWVVGEKVELPGG